MSESYEFLIEVIDRVADGYRLRVAFPDPDSPTGVGENRITAPFDPEDPELRQKLTLLPTSVIASAARTRLAVSQLEQTARDVGHRLFQALMVGETLGDLSRLRRRAQAAGADVRVSLRIQPAELAVLPWEYLFDARSDKREFLGRACMLTRSSGDLSPVPPLEVAGPLRVLAMVSMPGDLSALDVERERRQLADALAPMAADGRMELHWIPATKAALQAAMNQQRWHVFHYIGHGDFDPATGDGRLAFTGSAGGADFVSARQLSAMFGPHPTLRLVVLNACQSAQSSADDRQSGIASALVHAGLAAVVAMQFPITDGAAPVFSGEFYATLAAGRAVDQCVRAGRTAITLDNDSSLEWGTPVLHLRSADGLLFRQSVVRVVEPFDTADPAPAGDPSPDQPLDQPLGEQRATLFKHLGMDFIAARDNILRKNFSDALVRDLTRIAEGYDQLGDTDSAKRARAELDKARDGLRKDRGVRLPPPTDAVPPKPSPYSTLSDDDDDEEQPRSRTKRSVPSDSSPTRRSSGGKKPTSRSAAGSTLRFSHSSSITMDAPVTALALSHEPVPRLGIGTADGVAYIQDPDVPGGAASGLQLRHQFRHERLRRIGSPPGTAVRRIVFGPFGNTITCMTGTEARSEQIAMWDARTGVPLAQPSQGTHFVYHPTSPDHFVAAGGWHDLSLRRFDAPFTPLARYNSDGGYLGPELHDVVISPDGQYVAAVGVQGAVIYRVHDGSVVSAVQILVAHHGVMFSPDSTRIVMDSSGWLLSYRVADGRVLSERSSAPYLPSAVSWAVSSTGLVVGLDGIPASSRCAARFFHMDRPGREMDLPGDFSAQAAPVFSPESDFVVLLDADQHTVHLIDVEGEL